jgi:hypothetical protein
VVTALLRYFSYVFHGLLAVFLLGVSSVALGSDPGSLRLDMLPWTGPTLAYVVFCASLCGLAAVILALRRKLAALLFIWSLAVSVMLIKGYVFSAYGFDPGGWYTAALLIGASLIAAAGAWSQMHFARS